MENKINLNEPFCSCHRVNPILLLLLGVGDEVHGVGARGELEGIRLVEDVFGAFDGEVRDDGDHIAWTRCTRDGGVLEPEELALLEDKPTMVPSLDVLALLGEPAAGPLGVRPELNAVVVGGVVRHADCHAPQACHRSSKMRRHRERERETDVLHCFFSLLSMTVMRMEESV